MAKLSGDEELRDGSLRTSPLWLHDVGDSFRRQITSEGDTTTVRRPGWIDIGCGIISQPERLLNANLLDVNVGILVALGLRPDKRDLVAIRGKTG